MSLESRLQRLEERALPSTNEPCEIIIRFVNPDGRTVSVFNPQTGEHRDISADEETDPPPVVRVDLTRGWNSKENP